MEHPSAPVGRPTPRRQGHRLHLPCRHPAAGSQQTDPGLQYAGDPPVHATSHLYTGGQNGADAVPGPGRHPFLRNPGCWTPTIRCASKSTSSGRRPRQPRPPVCHGRRRLPPGPAPESAQGSAGQPMSTAFRQPQPELCPAYRAPVPGPSSAAARSNACRTPSLTAARTVVARPKHWPATTWHGLRLLGAELEPPRRRARSGHARRRYSSIRRSPLPQACRLGAALESVDARKRQRLISPQNCSCNARPLGQATLPLRRGGDRSAIPGSTGYATLSKRE